MRIHGNIDHVPGTKIQMYIIRDLGKHVNTYIGILVLYEKNKYSMYYIHSKIIFLLYVPHGAQDKAHNKIIACT